MPDRGEKEKAELESEMSEGGASTDSVREASETVGEAMAASRDRDDDNDGCGCEGGGGRKGFGVVERGLRWSSS